jgi:hypothetical protein
MGWMDRWDGLMRQTDNRTLHANWQTCGVDARDRLTNTSRHQHAEMWKRFARLDDSCQVDGQFGNWWTRQTGERTNWWSDRMQMDLWPAWEGGLVLFVATPSSHGRRSGAECRWTGCKQTSRFDGRAVVRMHGQVGQTDDKMRLVDRLRD